jgi:hypothetical protein
MYAVLYTYIYIYTIHISAESSFPDQYGQVGVIFSAMPVSIKSLDVSVNKQSLTYIHFI